MATVAKAIRYTAFGLTILLGVLGGMFIVAETLADPGGVTGALLSALWVLPTMALAAHALARPNAAAVVLTAVAVGVAAFVVLDELLDIVPRDEVGPVGAIAVFATGVALGFLGLRRPVLAGGLLWLVATANLAVAIGVGDTFGGSAVAAAVPALVLGALFLAAGWCRSRHRFEPRSRPDRAPATTSAPRS